MSPLRELGYRVVVHDAPSHGDSTAGEYGPRSSRVMEMAHAHPLVVERHGTAALTVTHSLGAMAVLWAASRHGTKTGALVTIAAAIDLDELVDTFRRITGLGARRRAELLDHIERTVGHPLAAFSGPALAEAVMRRHGALPLLAVHDTSDPEAPSAISEQQGIPPDGGRSVGVVHQPGRGHHSLPSVLGGDGLFAA